MHTHLFPIISISICAHLNISKLTVFSRSDGTMLSQAHTHTLFQTPSPSLVASPCEWLRLHRLKRAQCFYAFNAQTDKICLDYHHTAACPKYLYYSTHIYIYVQIVSLFCWDCIYLSPQRTHHTTCCIEY